MLLRLLFFIPYIECDKHTQCLIIQLIFSFSRFVFDFRIYFLDTAFSPSIKSDRAGDFVIMMNDLTFLLSSLLALMKIYSFRRHDDFIKMVWTPRNIKVRIIAALKLTNVIK